MTFWTIMAAIAAILAMAAALYGLHRSALWLESRGLLYYRHKRPTTSAAGCFVGLERVLAPQIQQVETVLDEKRSASDEEAPGAGKE